MSTGVSMDCRIAKFTYDVMTHELLSDRSGLSSRSPRLLRRNSANLPAKTHDGMTLAHHCQFSGIRWVKIVQMKK